MWQEIEDTGHICHWWQESDPRRITAMTDTLLTALTVAVLLAGLAGLVRFARHDGFAAPGTGYQHRDELGPFTVRRRPA
jgi:hypothetical protein